MSLAHESQEVVRINESLREFRFLELPPEVRNMVYGLIHVSPDYIGAGRDDDIDGRHFFQDAKRWLNLAFISTCKLIYHESTPFFYKQNGFEFTFPNSGVSFLRGIGPGRRQLITKIRAAMFDSPWDAVQLIGDCKSIVDLDMYVQSRECRTLGLLSWWIQHLQNPIEVLFNDNVPLIWSQVSVKVSLCYTEEYYRADPAIREQRHLQICRSRLEKAINRRRRRNNENMQKRALGKPEMVPCVLR